MSFHDTTSVPVFAVSDEDGRQMHLVMSLSTFRAAAGESQEAVLPVVEDALNLAHALSGTDLLHSFYLHSAPGDTVVRRIRNIMKRVFSTDRPVLWLRADSEQFLKAALSILQVDYPGIRVILPKATKEAA